MERKIATDQLSPHLPLIASCIEHGWEQWQTKYADKHYILDARARATIVNCEIRAKASLVFEQVEGVVLKRKNGTLFLYIGDDILVRFKKLKNSGQASNIMTDQQLSLYGQIPIPGILPGNHFNAGYILDDLQQSIERMLIAYQEGKRVVWMLDIDSYTGAAAEAEVVARPIQKAPKPESRVRARRLEKTGQK